MKEAHKCLAAQLGTALALGFAAGAAAAPAYTLVQGLDKFEGSTVAWHLLETNGFVVTDPSFKQIFEPYLDDSMPVFITPDSAWHAYHVLLSEGIHALEAAQRRRLADFSRSLWVAANEQAGASNPDFSELARFAAIGLGLQDASFRQSLPNDQKQLAEALLAGQGEVRPSLGFPLLASSFKAAAYESPASWAGYVAARQWYGMVVFRLSDARETRLALCLSWLIHQRPDLLQMWKQLSEPWDVLLAPAEDGSVGVYWDAAEKKLGPDFTLATLTRNTAALQSRLAEWLANPSVNDQILPADDEPRFATVTKGFRLFPPHRLPGDGFFEQTSRPGNPGRKLPLALEFFVASPILRSPAAERALKMAEGAEMVEALRKSSVESLPDSLSGRALRLLATLQKPLPEGLAPALRSEAWADAQLWVQMGAWAEEAHRGAVHRTLWVEQGASVKPSSGMVAPYPAFFTGLGQLALDSAAILEKAGIEEPFDSKTAASMLLEAILWHEGLGVRNEDESERTASLTEQFNQFWQHSTGARQAEIENNPLVAQKLVNELEALARRCSTQTTPVNADRDVLLSFFQEQPTTPRLLRDFAPFCARLAELAQKHLDGTALTEDDIQWMADYGTTLAHFQSYSGNSADTPHDDFPIVNRARGHSESGADFYTGLGHPQALYIILPSEGKLRLFRGAVLTYREFTRTNTEPLDDESWRDLAHTGDAPPPPAYTKSFWAERDAAEMIQSLASADPETRGFKEIVQDMEALQSRVTDRDVPALIAGLGKSLDGKSATASEGIADAIARLHWQANQRDLLALLEKNDGHEARTVARILLQRPECLDAVFLSTNFEHTPPPARCVYCALLSRLPQSELTRAALVRALADPMPMVRWEAATVVATTGNAPDWAAALLGRLNDTNEFVTAAAASALGQLRATNTAPALLANLEERLQKPEPSGEELTAQSDAARSFPLNPAGDQPFFTPNGRMRFGGARMGWFAGGFGWRDDGSPARAALIEALGELHYQPAEDRLFGLLDGLHALSAGKALKLLAPEKLAHRLEADASDKKADPQTRDRALLLLATPPANSSAAPLIPLLDDTTVVPGRRPMPGREWRICDQAATTIATLLGRPARITPTLPIDQRDQQIDQIRQSLKAAY